ncbi:hypothetical protein YC2023_108541 [Brassica napus]
MSVAVHQYTYKHFGPWTQHADPSRGLFGTSVAVRVCLCVSVSTHKTSVAVHQYTYQHVGPWTQHTDPSCGLFGTSMAVHVCPCVSVCGRQHTQDVRGCPSVHISARWPFPWTVWVIFGPRGLFVQYTQDVCGCLPAHTGRLWLSGAVCQHTHDYTQYVRGCPPAHTGRLWLSVSTHRTSVAICVCPSAHTGRPWVSVSTHMTSVGVRQHTHDVCVYPSAHTGRPWLSVCVRQHTQDVRGCPSVYISACCTHRTSVDVRKHTQDIRRCPCVSVCVRLCPSAHTGCPWLSISTHISTLVLGLSTLTLLVDCSGDFGPRGLSVQYTQDVRGCPSAHTGRPCMSVSTHRTSVAVRVCPCVSVCVRVCPSAHTRRLWLSISTHISTLVLGLSTLTLPVDCSGDFGPRGLSVQYTQDVRGCPSAHTGRPCVFVSTHRTSVAVRVCLCVFVSTHKTSVAVHQYTYQHVGPWTQHTDPSCGLFGTFVAVHVCPCVSVCGRQHTQDVCGLHTGRLWVSASTHRTSVAVRGYLTHITSVAVHQYTYQHAVPWTQHVGPWTQHTWVVCSVHTVRPWVSASTHRTSVAVCQHTQDVRGCLCVSVSTHRTSVGVRQHTHDVRGCPTHTGRSWLSISIHISMLVLGLSMLTLPVDCSGDFGPRGLSVQYTQVVRGCPQAHTGRLWLPVCVGVCPSAHTGCPWLSISTHISTLVLGLSTLTLLVDCSGDFGPRGLSVQYTQDVRGCPSAHTGRPCMSVSTHRTSVAVRVCPCVSVCVRVCPSAHTGRLWLSISTHISTLVLGLSRLTLPVDCSGDFGPRGLSVQYTQDVRGCPSAHTGRPCVFVSTHRTSVAVRVCLCVSVSTHKTSVAVHQYTYQHVGPWTQHTDPSCGLFGTSVAVHVCPCVSVCGRQHTQDVLHTGRLWVSASTHRTSVAVRGCLTHITSVAVHQYTYQHAVPWTQHVGPWTQHTWVVCSVYTVRPWVSASTHRTFVAVCQHTQDVRGCLCVSVSTHRMSVGVRQHTHDDVCGCLCVSVCVRQHTHDVRGCPLYAQDVRGCPPAHIGCLWLSVCVRVCPYVSVSTQRTYVAVHQYTYQHVGPWTQHAGPSRGLFGQHTEDVRGCPCVSVCVRQHTQDVRGSPSAHTGRLCVSVSTHMTSVAVRVCPCVSISTYMTSMAVHQYTYQHVCPWTQHADPSRGLFGTLALPVDCSGDFGPPGLSVQYTKDVRGCSSAYTGRVWVSVCVRVCPLAHTGRPTHWTSMGVRQHTQDVRVCPSAHRTCVAVRVCPCVSVSTHRTSVANHHTHRTSLGVRQHTQDGRGCPCASVCVRQHTQDVRDCPSLHISARCTHRTSVGVHQHTHDVRGCPSAHTGHLWLSVAVHQHTQDVCGCPWLSVSTHTGRPWLSVCACVCPCVSVSTNRTCGGRPWLSISTHSSTLVLGLSTLTLPEDCSGDLAHVGCLFSTHRTSVGVCQHTQDVRGCLPAHTGHPRLSDSTHRTSVAVRAVRQHTQDVRGCPWLSVSTHTGCPWLSVCVRQHTHDVCVCPSAHTGRPWLSISTHSSTLVLRLSTLALPVDCLGDFGPHGLSVNQHTEDVRGCPCVSVCVRQHTQDVRGSPSAHTGRLCVSVSTHMTSVAVRVCPCVSISTYMTSMAVHHTHRTSVGVHQHTQDVRGCPCESVSVRQHTQDVRGCPSVHISARWFLDSARCTHRTSVGVRQHTQDVCGCPCVSVSTHRTSVAVNLYTYQHVGPWTQHADLSRGLFGTSVAVRVCPCVSVSTHRTSVAIHHTHRTSLGVRQHTQDGRGCPCASVCVRQHTQDVRDCPSLHISARCTHRTSVGVHQHTHDVRGCPSAHTGHLWLSVAVHQHTQDVCGCPWLSHKQDMRGCPSAHTGRLFVSVSTQDVRGLHTGRPWVSASTHKTSVGVCQHTQDIRGCPTAHTGRLWLSVLFVSTHRTSVAVHGCPSAHTQDVRGCPCVSVSTHMTSVCVRQHTLDVRGCPSVHIAARCTHRTSVGVRQHTGASVTVRVCPCVSVCVPQHTQDVCGCPSVHISALQTGRPWVSASTHRTSMCRPNPTPHLTMSSARIDPPKRVLGLKEGVVTPPPIHGSFHKVGLESRSTGSSFTAGSANPFPLAVVSLDSRQGHSELAVRRPGKDPERAIPSPSPGRHEAVRSRHVSSSSSPPTVDEFGTGTPSPALRANPFLEVTDPFCRLPLPTLFHRPEAVHLGDLMRHTHTRTLLRRSRSVGYAPVRDPANQLPCALRVYSPVDSHTCQTPWSMFQDGSNGEPTGRRPELADAKAHRTCSLSVSRPYLALDGIYRPIGAAFPNNPTRRQRLMVQQGPGTTGLSPSLAPLSRELGPGSSLRTLLQTTIQTPQTSDFQAGFFPARSPLLRESLLVSFPPLIDMLKLSG